MVVENVVDVVVVELEEEIKVEVVVVEYMIEEIVIVLVQVVEKLQDVVCVDDDYNYVSVLMMCVLVLEYVLEILYYSDWQCFFFYFEGKGVVGGYSVICYVSVLVICLQLVE